MTDAGSEQLEGRTSVLAALEAGRRRFDVILIAEDVEAPEVEKAALERKVALRRVKPEGLTRMAHSKTFGGVIAVCTPRPFQSLSELQLVPPAFLLLLDGVDDPRDLGQILRTADAFGVQAVLLRRRAWDFDSCDVSRASSGAFERMDVVLVGDDFRIDGVKLYGCLANVRTSIHETDLTAPVMLAVGGEKRGLSRAVRDRCDDLVRIPTRPGAASLSLTQAAAVALSEGVRQRRMFR
jgi:23S rRNA (guanosine2251-2'-O)-methyltransferase